MSDTGPRTAPARGWFLVLLRDAALADALWHRIAEPPRQLVAPLGRLAGGFGDRLRGTPGGNSARILNAEA